MAQKHVVVADAADTPFKRFWGEALYRYLLGVRGTQTLKRAHEYMNRRAISDAWVEDEKSVAALIEGSDFEPYETDLSVNRRGRLIAECSCPVGGECKHATALALIFGWEAYKHGDTRFKHLTDLFPAEWTSGRRLPEPDLITGLDTLFEDPAAAGEDEKAQGDRPKKKRSAAPAAPPAPWWRRYLDAPDSAKRLVILRNAVQSRTRGSAWSTEAITSRLAKYDNPIDVLRHFDSVIESQKSYYYLSHLQPRDPELQAFLESDEIRELTLQVERRMAEERLMGWLNKPVAGEALRSGSPVGHLKTEWLTRPLPNGLQGLYFRVLVLKLRGGFTARKPQGVITLANEVRNNTRAFDPLQQRFITWVADRPEVQTSRYSYYEEDPEHDKSLLPLPDAFAWMATWGDTGLLRWEDGGGAVSLIPSRAVLSLAASDGGQVRWVLRTAPFGELPGGEIELADAALVVETESWARPRGSSPRIFLRDGNALRPVETHGMPLDVLASARMLPELPVKKIAETSAGMRLARRLSLTDSSASSFLAEVPVAPVVELRVDDGLLSVGTWARSADEGRRFVRHAAGQWEPMAASVSPDGRGGDGAAALETIPAVSESEVSVSGEEPERAQGEDGQSPGVTGEAPTDNGAAPPRPETVLVHLPRRKDLEPVEEWLEQLLPPDILPSVVPGPVPRMTWKLTPTAHARLLEAWAIRPTRVEYLGDEEFRELVEIRQVPRFSISVDPSGVDWLKVSIDVEQELEALSFGEVASVLSEAQHELVVLKGGRVFRRGDLEEWRAQVESLGALGLSAEAGEQRLHALHLAGAPSGTLDSLDQVSPDLHRLADSARSVLASFHGIPAAPVAPETAAFLRPYQRSGADFVVWAARTFGGAVLADDMGLGKTLQVLAALTALRAEVDSVDGVDAMDAVDGVDKENTAGGGPGRKKSTRKSAPSRSRKAATAKDAASNSELKTPNSELSRLPTLVICPASVAHNWQREVEHFAPALRVLVLERGPARHELLGKLGEYDLVVINYALVRRDIKALSAQPWMAIVVDEAQAIKNPQAEISRAVKTLNSRYRIALTGTPIENRILDLWSIVDFALPGYFGRMDPAQATSSDPATAARFYVMLRARLRPVLLRRVKAEVAPELPERIENRIDCAMETKQQKIYLAELKRARLMLEGAGSEVKGKHRIQILSALTRLRQICCSPALVGYPEVPSAKVEQLVELLASILESGHKVLVFSQFVRMLERLRTRLTEEKIVTHMLTGKSTRRGEIVDAFERDPDPSVFLISLKAGGTGLNLTSASQVILFDPWWNPAVEAQAIDRAHRIGQDKTVMAYRLVTEQTIEERILELQEKKRALVQNVLEEETFNRTLTRDDFEFLLTGERGTDTAPTS